MESKASPAYEALLRGELPQGESRQWFALFAAAMYLRTPAMVRVGAEVMGTGAQIVAKFMGSLSLERFESSLRSFETEHGAIDPEVRASMQEFMKGDGYNVVVARAAGLPILGAVQGLLPILASMGWAVLDAGKQYFITGDYPVTRGSQGEVHPIYGDGGFMSKDVVVTMPLSARRCLLMRWDKDAERIVDVARQGVRGLNSMRAALAERHLFADRRDDGIRRLGEKYKDNKFRMRVSGFGSNANPVEVVRRLEPREGH